jgi:hypothetical protein
VKERLVTLGLALGAFAVFYALFVPKPGMNADRVVLPVSTETRGDGYQALWRWLGTQGIQAVSFRDRYTGLARRGTDDTGNLLIATVPQQVPVRAAELPALQEWVRHGNTLLLLAALDDTPRWALLSGADQLEALKRMTGMQFTTLAEKKPEAGAADGASRVQTVRQALQTLVESQRSEIVPRGSHPLFAGVGAVLAQSDFPASRWRAQSTDSAPLLELGERTDRATGSTAAEPAVWLRRYGQGQVLVLGFASPLSNALIGEQGTARLFANIVTWSVGPHGVVLFDDAHQGLVDYYDAGAFFGDPRLHRSLLWICALWLLFVLGWQRLRPSTDGWSPMDVTTFIKVTGGFIAGKAAVNEVAKRLFRNFFNRIRQRLAMPENGEPVWEWLAAQASIPVHDLQELRQLHARMQTTRRVDLIRIQNSLTRMAGNLL